MEGHRQRVNQLNKEIGPHKKAEAAAKKEGKPFDSTEVDKLVAEKERLESRITANEAIVQKMGAVLEEQMNALGNIVDPTVPVSNDEANNRVEKTHGAKAPQDKAPLHHSEVMWRLGAYEDEPGFKIAGQRGYFLTGPGVLINMGMGAIDGSSDPRF